MRYDKIMRLPDGRRVMISVKMSQYGPLYELIGVYICEKGKRTWKNCVDTDSIHYRKLDVTGRKQYKNDKILEFVTKDEIYQAKLEFWNSIKPKQET